MIGGRAERVVIGVWLLVFALSVQIMPLGQPGMDVVDSTVEGNVEATTGEVGCIRIVEVGTMVLMPITTGCEVVELLYASVALAVRT